MIREADPLVLQPDPGILRTPVPPVREIDAGVRRAVDRMLELIRRTGCPALSGPLVGFRGRVVVVDLSRSGRRPVVLVNPTVEAVRRETQIDAEGCHALPGVTFDVERPVQFTVAGRARSGQAVRVQVGALLARILQHQLDHLDGRLLLDRMGPAERIRARRRLSATARCPLAC